MQPKIKEFKNYLFFGWILLALAISIGLAGKFDLILTYFPIFYLIILLSGGIIIKNILK